MRISILAFFLFAPVLSFSQGIFGDWDCQQYGIKMRLNNNGTYMMSHSQGSSQGQYQVQGNQLWMQDQNSQQPIMYTVQFTGSQLTLNDQNGVALPFARIQTTSSPEPPRDTISNSHSTANGLLAEENGIQLLQTHVEVGIGLTEFILGHKVKPEERQELQTQLIVEFKEQPGMVIQQIMDIDQSLRKLGSLTDPIQIGTARQQLYAALYLGTMQMKEGEKPLLVQVLNRYFKVLAIDANNQLVLTDQDAAGMLNYLAFLSYCQGQPVQLTQADQQSFFNQVTQQFPAMNMEQKQVICSGSLLWKIIESNWNQMTPSQQQQFVASMNSQMGQQGYAQAQQQGNSYYTGSSSNKSMAEMQSEFNAKQNMFNMMQNMNTNSHALSLNIIENMGGTGNYWEVSDPPYWQNY